MLELGAKLCNRLIVFESEHPPMPVPPNRIGGHRHWWVFGGVLLFHPVWVVSSALAGLASGFGMGPGVSLSLCSP